MHRLQMTMLEHVQLNELIERCRSRIKLGTGARAPASIEELEAGLVALAGECSRMTAALEWYSKVRPTGSQTDDYLATYPVLAQMMLAGAEHESIEQAASLVPRFPTDPDALKVLEILRVETPEAEMADVTYEL